MTDRISSHEDSEVNEINMATWILGKDPLLEDEKDAVPKADLVVHGKCPHCGKSIYEKYYSGEKEDFLAGREICSACNAGCIKFIVYIYDEGAPIQDANGKCCRCGNDVLKEL
ncbi:MAG: hypothetical protein ACYC69_16515 [Thermodesulfovibrionales bacterium]